jgi:Type II CAAX prenyl endopeptidase Rce1-like
MAIEGLGPDTAWLDEPAEIADRESAALPPLPQIRWRLGLILLVLSLLGTVAMVPYSITLMRQMKDSMITPAMEPVIMVVTLFIEGAMSAAAIAVGIGLGRRAGLGPFLLEGFDGGIESGATIAFEGTKPDRSRAWKAIGLASGLGIVLGAIVVASSYVINPWMPQMAMKIEHPAPLEGLFASIGAGIREEVWLRLGLMTLLAWLGTVIARRETGNPAMIWAANVLAALGFGAMHLPQAAALIGLNAAVVGFVFIGNGIPGIVFGWLFWRKGLIAAMLCHFIMDVVMKVIYPAVAT